MDNCPHYWIANSGRGGEPEFRRNRQMGSEPVMHVRCSQCGARTWLSEKVWLADMECRRAAIPEQPAATSPPGWKLVPIEPDKNMLAAAESAVRAGYNYDRLQAALIADAVWAQMLQNAPAFPGKQT